MTCFRCGGLIGVCTVDEIWDYYEDDAAQAVGVIGDADFDELANGDCKVHLPGMWAIDTVSGKRLTVCKHCALYYAHLKGFDVREGLKKAWCETCEEWVTWANGDKHPNGLGGHVVSQWEEVI